MAGASGKPSKIFAAAIKELGHSLMLTQQMNIFISCELRTRKCAMNIEHREDGVPQDCNDRSCVRLRGHGADVGAHKRGNQQDCDSKHHA
jgi:hypothetical protein